MGKSSTWVLLAGGVVLFVGLLLMPRAPKAATEEKATEMGGQGQPVIENHVQHNHPELPRPLISLQFIPGEAELLYRDVSQAISDGRPPMDGILKLRELAEGNSPDVDAIVYLYDFSLQSGQTDKAQVRLNQLAGLADGSDPNVAALYHLCWIYANGLLASKENAEQQAVWGKKLTERQMRLKELVDDDEVESAEAAYYYGRMMIGMFNQYEEALSLFEVCEDSGTGFPNLGYYKAYSLEQLGRREEALQEFVSFQSLLAPESEPFIEIGKYIERLQAADAVSSI